MCLISEVWDIRLQTTLWPDISASWSAWPTVSTSLSIHFLVMGDVIFIGCSQTDTADTLININFRGHLWVSGKIDLILIQQCIFGITCSTAPPTAARLFIGRFAVPNVVTVPTALEEPRIHYSTICSVWNYWPLYCEVATIFTKYGRQPSLRGWQYVRRSRKSMLL